MARLTAEMKRWPIYRADRGHQARVYRLLRRYGRELKADGTREGYLKALGKYQADFERSTQTWREERRQATAP